MLCPSCGQQIPDNNRFCGQCGAPTQWIPTSPKGDVTEPVANQSRESEPTAFPQPLSKGKPRPYLEAKADAKFIVLAALCSLLVFFLAILVPWTRKTKPETGLSGHASDYSDRVAAKTGWEVSVQSDALTGRQTVLLSTPAVGGEGAVLRIACEDVAPNTILATTSVRIAGISKAGWGTNTYTDERYMGTNIAYRVDQDDIRYETWFQKENGALLVSRRSEMIQDILAGHLLVFRYADTGDREHTVQFSVAGLRETLAANSAPCGEMRNANTSRATKGILIERIITEGLEPEGEPIPMPAGHDQEFSIQKAKCKNSGRCAGRCEKLFIAVGTHFLRTDTMALSWGVDDLSSLGPGRFSAVYDDEDHSFVVHRVVFTWDGASYTADSLTATGVPPTRTIAESLACAKGIATGQSDDQRASASTGVVNPAGRSSTTEFKTKPEETICPSGYTRALTGYGSYCKAPGSPELPVVPAPEPEPSICPVGYISVHTTHGLVCHPPETK